jgi:hypothetical protein
VAQRFCSHTQDLYLVAQRLPFAGVMEIILGKKFEGAISFHIDRVSEVAIVCWEQAITTPPSWPWIVRLTLSPIANFDIENSSGNHRCDHLTDSRRRALPCRIVNRFLLRFVRYAFLSECQ